jgi:thiol-disulfide isomerase/thioredoxin
LLHILLACQMLFLPGCASRSGSGQPMNASFQVPGEPAPRSLADFRGRVVAFTLWEPGCPDCDRQAAVLDQLNSSLTREGLICFVFHSSRERFPVASLRLLYGAVDEAEWKTFPKDRPVTVILDREGRVAERLAGVQDEGKLRKLLEPLLNG